MKKDQNLAIKNIQKKKIQQKNLQITEITLDNNHSIIRTIEDDHQINKIHKISHKTDIVDQIVETVNIEITIQDQIQTNLNFCLMPVPIQILEIESNQIIDLETLHIKEIEIIPTIGIETIQMIEILDIKILDHANTPTTDQTIIDRNITTIKIDYAIIHRTEIQVITIDKEATLSHHIGLTHVIKIHNKTIVVVDLKIKSKQIKFKQLKKLNQTPLVLTITKAHNCN